MKIEVTNDQIDSIVRQELQLAFELNRHPNRIDCSDDIVEPDEDLLTALTTVLEYFSAPDDHEAWLLERYNK